VYVALEEWATLSGTNNGISQKISNYFKLSGTCVPDTCMLLNIHLLYMLQTFLFFLSLAKELIRKRKSLKNILDKDASTDCTVKDIRSANTCTPHSTGCLYVHLNDFLLKLLEFWNSTSHISVFLFGIDLILKGCNLLNTNICILAILFSLSSLSALSCYRQYSWILLIWLLSNSISKQYLFYNNFSRY